MILRFQAGTAPEERAAVVDALEAMDVECSELEEMVLLGRDLDADEAVQVAALPGVASVAPGDRRALTVREDFLRRLAAASLVLGVLVLAASHVPVGLGPPADPLRTPTDLRPEWPVLAWYAFMDRAPAWCPSALAPLVVGLGILAWPFLGRRLAERRPAVHAALGAAAILAGLALAFAGVRR